ncbi:MAG: NAD(P)-binding domain-containing protein [Syntrophobacteraceae bacterium]|nr:NAD(P)-binding domain-containing protein [Syntrophobacteraceae bacterium]
MDRRIGFLGLGIMGLAMARNVAGSGREVIVHNRTASRVRELEQAGVSVATSPGELAEKANVVIAMLTGPEAIDGIWSS